ncbi:MAG: acetyl-CoA hydrolase/transferase C-terminal domain-containing protein [Ilumatobacteraceae bacterium]
MSADIDLGRYLRSGDTVVIGQGTAEPRSLVEALIEQRHAVAPLRLFVGGSFTGLLQLEHTDAFEYAGFGGVGRTATLTKAGVVDILPVHFGSLPRLMVEGRVRVDAVLVQVSTANAAGEHSLGLVVDYLPAAMSVARTVLAEVNPHVPFTFGDTIVAADRFAAVVHDGRPLIHVERRAPLPEDEVIGDLVAAWIPDGATIQFGIGGTPDAVLARLHDRNDLGVHSGLISDAVVGLIDAGVVTNRRKEIDAGVTVAGALFGSERLYAWAAENPALAVRALSYTHDAGVLASFGALFAINSAIEVDLTGQINGEIAAGQYLGLVGGQGAFARAAINSRSGRSIVALPSTARHGATSRIVTRLSGGITSVSRADADLVVTEHGVADLRGATLRERTQRLLAIADPRHRDALRAGEP